MLKIGTFSKLSKLSVRMLRHYDEIGLLRPCEVDSLTGYRYYGEKQLLDAGRIRCLRMMGFNLDTTKVILTGYQDGHSLERFLAVQKQEMLQREEEIRYKIRLIDSTINWLRRDGKMKGYDVTLKTLPERYVASVRQVLPAYEEEGRLWEILRTETAPQRLQPGSPCYSTAVFLDEEYRETEVDVEIQLAVQGTFQDTEHVHFKTVPAVQFASAFCNGPYEQIGEIHQAVAKWSKDNGYEIDGPDFHIYHVSPAQTENPDEYVTEVCHSVKKKSV